MNASTALKTITIVLGVSMTTGGAFGQVTADDFLPPVQGGPADVKNPDKVTIKGKEVAAATAQDALNAAAKENVRQLASGTDITEAGAKMVTFPSGIGFLATGMATYRTMENPVATRIAKRKAYVIAFTQAKKNLAETLGGLSNEGKETIREAMMNVNLPQDEMTNIETKSDEALTQAVNMMLRGFVIYAVKDDTTQNAVYVSIVTTPKTRGKLARPAGNAIEVDDLRQGLDQVINEVRAGVVPPVGGRIILMRKTGETAFVGFGSSVVRSSKNAGVQAKLNLSSQKIASMRAKDALCGLIVGDQAYWKGSVNEKMLDTVKEFETAPDRDPMATFGADDIKKLETAKETFVSKIRSTDLYTSARNGVLPAGINTKTWFDPDHAWAYAMSVYVPSATNVAHQTAEEMKNARIVQPVGGGGVKSEDGTGFTDKNRNSGVKRPGKDVKKGPDGRVGDDKEF